jgi:hypothetical protein
LFGVDGKEVKDLYAHQDVEQVGKEENEKGIRMFRTESLISFQYHFMFYFEIMLGVYLIVKRKKDVAEGVRDSKHNHKQNHKNNLVFRLEKSIPETSTAQEP